MSKSEMIRRLRLGDLRRLLRARCGHNLPDDDAGREYLWELLLVVSVGAQAKRGMMNAIEVNAPWMGADEARESVDQSNRMPAYSRKPTARELGERLRVSNREREHLKLWTIAPFDLTDQQVKEQRRAKDRARKRRRNRATGRKSRAAYLANSLTNLRPWEAKGISRRTWYRRRQKRNGTGLSAPKILNSRGHTCATEKSAMPRVLATRGRADRRRRTVRA